MQAKRIRPRHKDAVAIPHRTGTGRWSTNAECRSVSTGWIQLGLSALLGHRYTVAAERRLISERTKDGIAAARAKGKQPGRQALDQSRVDSDREMRRLGVSRPA